MKAISDFLRKFDSFGVTLNFKYKSKERYTTGLGGIVTLLFIALTLIVGIYNFIPFYNRKNFTTIHYTLKLAETEQIYFDKSKVAFSIGLTKVFSQGVITRVRASLTTTFATFFSGVSLP